MIRRNAIKFVFGLFLALFGLTFSAQAAPNPAETLVVTGNFIDSRCLAEVAQFYAGCNVLVCHPEADGKVSYFLLSKGDDSITIKEDVSQFVCQNLNPKNVVVLGDSRYVPYAFDESLRARTQFSVVRMASADWENNAKELASYLKKSRVASEYKKKIAEIRKTLERNQKTAAEGAQK